MPLLARSPWPAPNLSKTQVPPSQASGYAFHGLSLPSSVLRALKKRGIYCTPGVSVEHQHLARRYVLRGVESGGAVSDMGRACAFVSPDGSALPWLQSIHSMALNGRHAIFLAEEVVRLEMLRTVRTYELAITLYSLSSVLGRTRPRITSELLFRGPDGVLPFDLWKDEQKALRGQLTPIFYDRSGEVRHLPHEFAAAIKQLTAAVCCVGCKHTHVGVPPPCRRIKIMAERIESPITVGEPNWALLESVLSPCELENFMYMGRAGRSNCTNTGLPGDTLTSGETLRASINMSMEGTSRSPDRRRSNTYSAESSTKGAPSCQRD